MSNSATLICSLAAALTGNVTKKYYTLKASKTAEREYLFSAISCAIAALVLLIWGGFQIPSLFTFLLAVAFGIVTMLQTVTNMAALQCGPMSYTTVIISCSTLLSALSGACFFGEKIGWAQIVGIAFMLVSFVLAAEQQNQASKEKKTNWKWFSLCMAAFFATGGIGIMQKVHQSSAYKGELNAFLIVAFFISALVCLGFVWIYKRKNGKNVNAMQAEQTKKDRKRTWVLWGVMILNGISVALNNKWNLYLSGVMDSAVFFPIVNGGGLVLTTLAATLLFHEKLSKKQWIGLAFGILSVVFLCNPFA